MRAFCLLFFVSFVAPLNSYSQSDPVLLANATELYNKGEYEQALPLFEKCLAAARTTTDYKMQANLLDHIGHIFSQTGKMPNALNCYQQSATLADQTNNRAASARSLINIGALYEEQKDFTRALENYSKAETIGRQISDSSVIADCANNKGVVYEQYLKKYPEAIREYTQALAIYNALHDQKHVAITYNNLGIVYKYQGNYQKAIACYRKSLQTGEQLGNQFLIAANLVNIGNVYAMEKNYKAAIVYTNRSFEIALKIKAMNVVVEATGSLAQNYAGLKNYQQAFAWHQKFSDYSDSLFNAKQTEQIGELEGKYQGAKKEKQITQLKSRQQINELYITQQSLLLQKRNYQFAGIAGTIFLLSIVIFLLNNRQQLKQKQQREYAILAAEYKERKRISREMHDDIGAGLTQITLMSEHAQIHHSSLDNNLAAIASTSRKLIGNMSEIIWSLNPENKTLDMLLSYLREQLNNLLEYAGIEYSIQFPANIQPMELSNEQKRNILLATKEIVHNAVKYSNARQLGIAAIWENGILKMDIQDNGCGFDTTILHPGNGLRNIKQRIEEIGGVLDIQSTPGSGTTFSYTIPLQA